MTSGALSESTSAALPQGREAARPPPLVGVKLLRTNRSFLETDPAVWFSLRLGCGGGTTEILTRSPPDPAEMRTRIKIR